MAHINPDSQHQAGLRAGTHVCVVRACSEKSKVSLTVRRNYADTPISVPATDWDYVDAKLNAKHVSERDHVGAARLIREDTL
jgi:hypothetical protein